MKRTDHQPALVNRFFSATILSASPAARPPAAKNQESLIL